MRWGVNIRMVLTKIGFDEGEWINWLRIVPDVEFVSVVLKLISTRGYLVRQLIK
jgi:hypothetical protein